MKQRPNILFIMSDQHHPRMTGYRGHSHVRPPHLDRLASEGAHFTQAYCTNPICTPSRMSMITGQYTHRIGVPNNGFPLDRDWFMIVHDNVKYTWYSDGERPTLFDLAKDPQELRDVAADPAYASRMQACHERLLSVCDPEAESRRAKEQLGLVGPNGGFLTEGAA